MKLSGWGRYPVHHARMETPRDEAALRALVTEKTQMIARGNGRAYGDSAINPSATIDMRGMNRMLAFDTESGQLTVEAGVILGDIIAAFLPRGWFPMVTPGTKFVSVGGAIAADVHGKNHHKEGSFRNSVDWVEVMGADGKVTRCSPKKNAALFDYTLGGMGLTGVILRAALRLRPVETAWIQQTTLPAISLKAAMAAFENAQDATYSVAWIDCLATGEELGRSLVMLGEHARLDDLPKAAQRTPFAIPKKTKRKVPLDFPGFVLNKFSLKAFNSAYYKAGQKKKGTTLIDWDSYFYPLDAILDWNRIYGRRGFAQFQCVLPLDTSEAGLSRLLETIAATGSGSFLAVLKRFGAQESAFSFPMEGYTLALDFPISPKTHALLERLDAITLEHGGRFYLAKDSRMSADTLVQSDDRVPAFQTQRTKKNWTRFSSVQSQRLAL